MRILGVRFFRGTVSDAVSRAMAGGLVVIPSAPVLVRMTADAAHREALLGANFAIADSGYMVLLWRLIAWERLERISGLEYLRLLQQRLQSDGVGSGPVVWIMPNSISRDRNLRWLRASGHLTKLEDCYLAPVYPSDGPLNDRALLDLVLARRPSHIVICLGGGVQERLGYFLKIGLEKEAGASFATGIHCVGAAIGFLSGDQVRIPMWADYFYLGWLFRCFSAPRRFIPRYLNAVSLVLLVWRYGKDAPPASRI